MSARTYLCKDGMCHMYCRECRKIFPEGIFFCPLCGMKLDKEPPAKKKKKRVCKECGTALPADCVFCPGCGAKVERPQQPEVRKCPDCGAKLTAGAKFCAQCGSIVTGAVPVKKNTEQTGNEKPKMTVQPPKKTIEKIEKVEKEEPQRDKEKAEEEENEKVKSALIIDTTEMKKESKEPEEDEPHDKEYIISDEEYYDEEPETKKIEKTLVVNKADEDDDEEENTADDLDDDMDICPNCGGKVHSGAIVCRHCHYVFGEDDDDEILDLDDDIIEDEDDLEPGLLSKLRGGWDEMDEENKKLVLTIAAVTAAVILLVIIIGSASCKGCSDKKQPTVPASSQAQVPPAPVVTQTDVPKPVAVSYTWIVNPGIEADDINVIYCTPPLKQADTDEYDVSTLGNHRYDKVSAIKKGGAYGLIGYNGGTLSSEGYSSVVAGADGKYILTETNGTSVDTLSDLYERKDVEGKKEVSKLRGDYATEYAWIDGRGLFIRESQKKGWEQADPNEAMPEVIAVTFATNADVEYNDYGMDINLAGAVSKVLVVGGQALTNVKYEDAGCYVDGVIPVKLNGKWGYVNKDGRTVLDAIYDGCWACGEFDYKAYNASNGYIVVSKDGQYALYNTSGIQLIGLGEFSQMRPVYEGMCWVQRNGLWGVISLKEGAKPEEIVQPQEMSQGLQVTAGGNNARMRIGPSTDYAVCNVLSEGVTATLYGTEGDWSYISVDSIYGWISSKSVQ